jgi:hypothetical protein
MLVLSAGGQDRSEVEFRLIASAELAMASIVLTASVASLIECVRTSHPPAALQGARYECVTKEFRPPLSFPLTIIGLDGAGACGENCREMTRLPAPLANTFLAWRSRHGGRQSLAG